jgi:hypothetical protein
MITTPDAPINIQQVVAAGRKAQLLQYGKLIARVKLGETLPLAEQKILAYLQREIESDGSSPAGAQTPRPSGRSFSTALAVTAYLTEQGYKVRKSTVYNHHRQGLLRKRKNGTFALEDVNRYAAANLQRLDGTTAATPQLDQAQLDRLALENRRTLAETELAELKLESRRRDLITGPLQQELAARLIVLRSDMENFFRGQVLAIVNTVAGDPQRVPDLLSFCLTALETWLARYCQDREYRITEASDRLASSSPDADLADRDDESSEAGEAT